VGTFTLLPYLPTCPFPAHIPGLKARRKRKEDSLIPEGRTGLIAGWYSICRALYLLPYRHILGRMGGPSLATHAPASCCGQPAKLHSRLLQLWAWDHATPAPQPPAFGVCQGILAPPAPLPTVLPGHLRGPTQHHHRLGCERRGQPTLVSHATHLRVYLLYESTCAARAGAAYAASLLPPYRASALPLFT